MNSVSGISISVVIATRNRAASLLRTLKSLLTPSNVSARDWEVIVADNGSTDYTSGVCHTLKEIFPDHLRFVYENKEGKSNAVNTAFRAATGDFIALIDDDVICQQDYLESIRKILKNGFSAVAQGRIFVDYHSERPAWFDEDPYFDQMMLLSDLGDHTCELKRSLWGANVLLPSAAITKVGGYCPDLGAGANGFGEDAELDHRLRAADYRIIYAPELIVRHQVSGARLNASYILRRSFDIGRCGAYYNPSPGIPLWRYTLFTVKEAISSLPFIFWNAVRGKRGRAVRLGCDQLGRIGSVIQLWRFRNTGPPILTIPSIRVGERLL